MKKPRVIAKASNFLYLTTFLSLSLSLSLIPGIPLIRESDGSHLKGDQNISLTQIRNSLLERITKYKFIYMLTVLLLNTAWLVATIGSSNT
jgi:hypothetical protein